MFFPEERVRVHGRPVDTRKSLAGLIAVSERALGQGPLSGDLFVLVSAAATPSRRRDRRRHAR
jgi:hypothetical protein